MSDTRTSQNFFLGVEKSLLQRAWVNRLDAQTTKTANAIAQRHQLPELLGRVLAGREVPLEEIGDFLNPTLRALMPDPATLTDMEKAAKRLGKAVCGREKIAILGDYDVDGATSAALLARFLKHFDAPFEIYIPDRVREGYGANIQAVNQLIAQGACLIVTVDCGTSSFEALEQAQKQTCDVLVLDHHQVQEELPPATAIVNPNRQDDLSGQGHLAAVGVVFLTLVATLSLLRKKGHPGAEECDLLLWLDLVALGTLCDMAPLKGLNRAYIKKGLAVIQHRQNAGLNALINAVQINTPLTPYHFGFLLGPRINAGGRIGEASLGAQLLTCEDAIEAEKLANTLHELNKERQQMEEEMLQAALYEAEKDIGQNNNLSVLITSHEGWHSGIIGLIAARLKERFHRPAFAISFDKSGVGTGSGRSVAGVDLGGLVRRALEEGIVIKGGGHKMAAGLTLERANLGRFRSFMETHLSEQMQGLHGRNWLKIDGAVSANAATPGLIALLEQVGPYGAGHEEPVFVLPGHYIHYPKIVGKNHIRMSISSGHGPKLDGIAFRAVDTPLGHMLLSTQGKALHLAGTFYLDHWGGRAKVKMRLIDAAVPV